MNNDTLILELKNKVKDALIPLIKGKKCIYIDLPYHQNIGDTLIWQGTEDLLKENKIKVIQSTDLHNFKFPELSPDVVILLHGGGNFGDLWSAPHKFRTKVIEHYPKNKIIILPQSVWYNDKNKIEKDVITYGSHKDLTIFVRDQQSYDRLKNVFKNDVFLIPDMAFCINFNKLRKMQGNSTNKFLLMKRNDHEINTKIDYKSFGEVDIHDWPTLEDGLSKSVYLWAERIHYRLPALYDWYWKNVIKPYNIKQGVKMLSQYENVISTRLHGYILCLLLGKPVSVIDNSYGKNRSLYETWLKEAEGITFIDK